LKSWILIDLANDTISNLFLLAVETI